MTNFASWTNAGVSHSTAPPTAGPSPKLRQAAAEFESSFMQELLKPFKQDPLFAEDKDSGGEVGGSLGTIDSMGTQAMADALAKSGGLGIATQILKEMAPIEAAQTAKTAAGQSSSEMKNTMLNAR